MRRGLALGLVVLAVGCSRSGFGPTPRHPDAAQVEADTEPENAGPSLEQIADAIDPGQRPALTMDLPAWLDQALGVTDMQGDSATLGEAARVEFRSFEALGEAAGGDAGLSEMVALVRALCLAERAAGNVEDASIEALLMLERIYALTDVPALADERNPFGQTVSSFINSLAQQGLVKDAAALEELSGLAARTLRSSGDLHRRTVAAILRRAPEHPDVPDVLERLGPRILDEDEALAAGVMQRSLFIRGATATADHWLGLADVCHRVLDIRCGRDALSQAEAVASTADSGVRKRLLKARKLAKSAYRAVDLQDAAGLEDGLDRGRALDDLQRYDEARDVFEQLHRRHPDDARPVVGLARAVLSERFDFVAAGEVIERAQPREHLDRDWYELVIGVRATVLLYTILPQIADRGPQEIFEVLRPELIRIREDIGALEALGVDEGRVLRFLYDQGMQAWPKLQSEDDAPLRDMARGLLSRAQGLLGEVPKSRHAYTLLLAVAEFSDQRVDALSVIDVEPPTGEHTEALAFRRAQAAFDLVAAWDADDRVPDMLRLTEAAAGEGSSRAARRLAVDAQVLARRLGARSTEWAALEQRYRALLEEPGADKDTVLLNNLAVVVAEQGRTEDAVELWLRAIHSADEDGRDVPLVNLRGFHLKSQGAGPKGSQGDIQHLRTLAESGSAVEVRLLAHAWLAALTEGSEKRKATRALREAAAREAAKNYRPRNLPGRGGVILRGSFEMGLGYATLQGLQMQVDVNVVPWLVAPCPVAIPDPRSR